MNPLQITAAFALVVCIWHLVPLAKELYQNRKKGTALSEDWGATVCAIVGFALLAIYYTLPPTYLIKWHGMLAFVGINLMIAGLISRFRYLGKYSKSKPGGRVSSSSLSKRIPHR